MGKAFLHGQKTGGGSALGVPVYPLNTVDLLQKDDVNGTLQQFYGEPIATAPENIYKQASCTIGDEMYFIGTADNVQHCYKYNVKTRVWTRLADCSQYEKNWAVPVGLNIYYAESTKIYKYDILNNTHTLYANAQSMGVIGSISYESHFENSSACTDGVDTIYIFGGNVATNFRTLAVKFEISTSKYTLLTNIPVEMYDHSCVYGGNGIIYLFGGYPKGNSAYRYNITTNSYTELATMPFLYRTGIVLKVERKIYLINTGSSSPSSTVVYCFDLSNQTYTRLEDTPNDRRYGHGGVVDGVMYLVGGSTTAAKTSGESMLVMKVKTLNASIQKLIKGVKCYTDGNVMADALKEIGGQPILDSGTILEKVNGAVTIPADGDYVLVGSNYATIGG